MKIIRKRGDRIRIRHNRILFWIIIFLIVLLIILIYSIIKREDKPDNRCVTDRDCVKVQTTCCKCNMGGTEKCALISESSEYLEKLKMCEENILCAAFENCRINSCSCMNGECIGR